jgi:serine/threonine-protein kinase
LSTPREMFERRDDPERTRTLPPVDVVAGSMEPATELVPAALVPAPDMAVPSSDGAGGVSAEDDGTFLDDLLRFHSTRGRPVRSLAPREHMRELSWNANYEIEHVLGSGAQGVVYLANRHGVDGYCTKVAVKVFYRDEKLSYDEYVAEMRRVAHQAQKVSEIQHDNLINVRDFVSIRDTRVMVLEWIDGIDLAQLLRLDLLESLRLQLDPQEWERLNEVILTAGEDHCRLRPGIAIDILHGCLAGLSALHNNDIAHCDLKPSNIMIKRTGIKKIIDIDSSCVVSEGRNILRGTPYYMSPEQLLRDPIELHSDIASLGYVLIEMLTGRLLFRDCTTHKDLLRAKQELPSRVDTVLPPEVKNDSLLFKLIHKMIAIDPRHRFPDADAADLDRVGAVSFHRRLVRDNLATEYDRELSWVLNRIADAAAAKKID